MSEPLRQQLRQIAAAEMALDAAHDPAHLDRVWLTERGRQIARTRVAVMLDFITHFASEIGAQVPSDWSKHT